VLDIKKKKQNQQERKNYRQRITNVRASKSEKTPNGNDREKKKIQTSQPESWGKGRQAAGEGRKKMCLEGNNFKKESGRSRGKEGSKPCWGQRHKRGSGTKKKDPLPEKKQPEGGKRVRDSGGDQGGPWGEVRGVFVTATVSKGGKNAGKGGKG